MDWQPSLPVVCGVIHVRQKLCFLFSRRFNVPLLEDAAQSFGASTPCGQEDLKGRVGCFSTNEYKLLSTEEGGFVSTNDTDLAERLRAFIRLGFDRN
ncbi:DegT/DnrJ/EryC1/StrS family aminotransferase [Pantoea allii]|uniref:DegT/DnrJ/EryC1/StrS family aminotransferase n=1 Tax=Pantoea allii TaxID=574096 RepID=UPI003D3110D7